AGILVDPEIAEQPPDLAACRAAEEIGERERALRLGVAVVDHLPSPGDGRRHREELHDDVHAAEEEALLSLHLPLVDRHAVEALARELAAAPLDEAQVRREPSPVAVAKRTDKAPQPEGRVPSRVVAEDPRERAELLAPALLRVDHRTRHLQVFVTASRAMK